MSPAAAPAAPTPRTAPAPGDEQAFAFYRSLGRTGLRVSCLGIGGGGGISSADVLYAYERGINYFFFSSDLHHYLYGNMAEALRTLCRRGSAERENVVLGLVSYIKTPQMIQAAALDQFMELGIDYVDVFFWGWVDTGDRDGFGQLMQLSRHIRGPDSRAVQKMEAIFGASERMKRMGAVRYVGASFHDVDIAAEWMDSPWLDVVMVRNNPAHRSAQARVLRPLAERPATRPGVVTFKSNAGNWGSLCRRPERLPAGCWMPSHPDLYRYSLAQPTVDVCLTGPRTRSDIDAALDAAAAGPLSPAEVRYLDLYGDLWRPDRPDVPIPFDALLYR